MKTKSPIGKMLMAILILFAFSAPFMSSASAASSIPAATFFLSPFRIQGTAGQNVNVTFNVKGITLLTGWQVGLIWSNTSVAQCTKVTNGSALNPYVRNLDYVAIPNQINNAAGIVSPYEWALLNTAVPSNLNGSAVLAVFTFHMLKTGYSDVHINNMFTIYPNSGTIPCNIIDYSTIVRGGTQYIVKLEGNPIDSNGIGGFDPLQVTQTSQTIKGVLYNGSMAFGMNGTSDDCGPFAYFNVTIPNGLMGCTSPSNWVVEVNGVQQKGVIVNTGAQNTTISLSSTSDPSFAYSTYGSGILTQNIVILSNNIATRYSLVGWWPMFHHDLSHTGASTTAAPTTNNTIWTYTTGGAVSSSPAVVGGLVFVGSYDGKFCCLNATNGPLVWNYTVSYKTGNDWVQSSPAVAGGLVYFGSWNFKVYCLNATNGAFVWSYTTGSAVFSSPAVVNGIVYVGSNDGKIYAFGPPLIVSVSPTSVTMDVGQSCLFNSTVSGGWSPYSYQWYLNNALVSGVTSPAWTFTPHSAGSYTVYVKVTDNAGMQATSNTATVTVKQHDVAVTSVTPSKTVICQGFSGSINVTVANLGNYTETYITFIVYVNATYIGSLTITLSTGQSDTATFVWNTAGFAFGNYTISAEVAPVPGEADISNNILSGRTIKVTIPGDINGDGHVNLKDLGLITGHWQQKVPPAPANADILNAGVINLRDLGVVTGNWQNHA